MNLGVIIQEELGIFAGKNIDPNDILIFV